MLTWPMPVHRRGHVNTLRASNGQMFPVAVAGLTIGAEYDVTIQAKPLPGFLDGNVRATVREGGLEVLPVTTIRMVAGTAMVIKVGPGVFRATRETHNIDVYVTGQSPPADNDAPTMRIRVLVSPTEY